MLALVMGTLVNGLTAFFIPMEAAEGWGRSGIAAINSFGLLGLAVGSVVMGFVSDRIGIRALCLVAVTAMGACGPWPVLGRPVNSNHAVDFGKPSPR